MFTYKLHILGLHHFSVIVVTSYNLFSSYIYYVTNKKTTNYVITTLEFVNNNINCIQFNITCFRYFWLCGMYFVADSNIILVWNLRAIFNIKSLHRAVFNEDSKFWQRWLSCVYIKHMSATVTDFILLINHNYCFFFFAIRNLYFLCRISNLPFSKYYPFLQPVTSLHF